MGKKLNKEEILSSEQGKCLGCGGNLIFCPPTQDLCCEKCSKHYEIINDNKVEIHSLYEKSKLTRPDDFQEVNKLFKCPNCGANIVLNQFEIAKKCPYCGTSLVIEDRVMQNQNPDACIPFAFDEREAGEYFVKNVKKNFFVPNKFKKNIPENKIHGIYIPAFGFDAKTVSSYRGRLYNEHTHTDSNGHSHTTRSYFSVSGTHNDSFEDVIVECSSKITQAEIEGVIPYNCEKKKAYKNSYIMGYSVEHYNETVDASIPKYKSIVDDYIRRNILRKYSYDGVDYLNVSTSYSDEKYKYYLLPIYRFEYKYKNKDYSTYMNGQTGKIDNNVPKSKLKIALTILIPLLIILLFIILGHIN